LQFLILTFDDGYWDNFEIVLPILKKYDLPAVFFVCTGYIEKGEMFWFEKVVYQIKKMKAGKLTLNSGKFELDVNQDNRAAALTRLNLYLKNIPQRQRLQALKEMDMQVNLEIPDREHLMVRPLKWEDITIMKAAVHEIGSHTVSHPVLSKMDEDDIKLELSESKRSLEENIGEEVISISYPSGDQNAYDERVIKLTEWSGYRFGICYWHGQEPITKITDLKSPEYTWSMNSVFHCIRRICCFRNYLFGNQHMI
jgi:peptidoglycan/xylan/chitin deacetylase (PgdA/CDA1 family)